MGRYKLKGGLGYIDTLKNQTKPGMAPHTCNPRLRQGDCHELKRPAWGMRPCLRTNKHPPPNINNKIDVQE